MECVKYRYAKEKKIPFRASQGTGWKGLPLDNLDCFLVTVYNSEINVLV